MPKIKHILLRKEKNIIYWNDLKSIMQKSSPFKHISDEEVIESLKHSIDLIKNEQIKLIEGKEWKKTK